MEPSAAGDPGSTNERGERRSLRWPFQPGGNKNLIENEKPKHEWALGSPPASRETENLLGVVQMQKMNK